VQAQLRKKCCGGLETSASESTEKEGRMCVFAGKICVSVCGLVNWPLMVVVLFLKNVAKSSAVRVDGGRGLRREEKVLKSMRESEELLILLRS